MNQAHMQLYLHLALSKRTQQGIPYRMILQQENKYLSDTTSNHRISLMSSHNQQDKAIERILGVRNFMSYIALLMEFISEVASQTRNWWKLLIETSVPNWA